MKRNLALSERLFGVTEMLTALADLGERASPTCTRSSAPKRRTARVCTPPEIVGSRSYTKAYADVDALNVIDRGREPQLTQPSGFAREDRYALALANSHGDPGLAGRPRSYRKFASTFIATKDSMLRKRPRARCSEWNIIGVEETGDPLTPGGDAKRSSDSFRNRRPYTPLPGFAGRGAEWGFSVSPTIAAPSPNPLPAKPERE